MIPAYWLRARAEWRANRRLRLAGLVALVILAFNLAFALEQHRQVIEVQYAHDLELQARLEGMRGQKDWDERATLAEAALAEMRARMPEVSGPGLAQAELQSWLTALSANAALTESRIRVEDALDVPGYPDMWQVVARLDAKLPQYSDAAFLRALSAGLPWVQAERLEIGDSAPATLALVVRGYYRRAPSLEPQMPVTAPVTAGTAP